MANALSASSVAMFALSLGLWGSAAMAQQPPTVVLQPHTASYDLKLASDVDGLEGAKGRIALTIEQNDCSTYAVDYRFVARFQQEQGALVTDQRSTSTESLTGDTFTFDTTNLVDGREDSRTSGIAATTDEATVVRYSKPDERTVTIGPSMFPMRHTRRLIEAALAGEHIVQSRVYDGDADAEKELSTTAVIAPSSAPPSVDLSSGADAGEGKAVERDAIYGELAGLKAWRISESYYDEDSDRDGMPVFQTAYTLYENGVSDDLVLGFDDYTLEGGLATLKLSDAPDCAKASGKN